MALQAKKDFPEINFERSVMVGDAFTDLMLGRALNMRTVWVIDKNEPLPENRDHLVDIRSESFIDWVRQSKMG